MKYERGGVYIITNKINSLFYTGVTSELVSRVIQHKEKHYPASFSAKYNCNKLVYFEIIDTIEPAVEREKYIKGKSRNFKLELITNNNLLSKNCRKILRYGSHYETLRAIPSE